MRKRTRRKIRRWSIVVPVLLAAMLYFYFLLLPTAKLVLELAGSYASGVDLTIDRIELEYRPWPLLASAPAVLRLSGIKMASPATFEAREFVSIRHIDVHFTPAALITDPVVLSEVTFNGVSLNLERRELVTNAGIIMTHLEEFESQRGVFGLGRRFAIERLIVEDGSAQIAYARNLGPRGQRSVNFFDRPVYRIADTGQGVGPSVLLYQIIDRLVSEALVRVAREGEARAKLREQLSD